MAFLIREFLVERNTWIRGLAHPGIFDVESPLADDNTRDLFVKYGAVEVSPKSIFQVYNSDRHSFLCTNFI